MVGERDSVGTKFLKTCDDKATADNKAMEKFINEFARVISVENLKPKYVCILFWHYCLRKTLIQVVRRSDRN